MADLKNDLIEKIRTEKMYDELELSRLAQEPNMNYKIKIDSMSDILSKIAMHNDKFKLIEQYFVTQQPQSQIQPSGVVHQGQTHGE